MGEGLGLGVLREDGADHGRHRGTLLGCRVAEEVASPGHAAKLRKAAELVEQGVAETLSYYAFPEPHWRRIRTNNPLERIIREIRRRTRVVGAFPDGESALNLAAARLRHIAGTHWSTRRYLDLQPLHDARITTA